MARTEGTIGDRIKLARKARGLSARELATQVGISHTAINKYTSGLATPSSDTLIRLRKALGVSTEYLFRPFTVQLEKVEFRKRTSLLKAARHRIEAQVQDQLERALALEEFLPPGDIPRRKLPKWSCPNAYAAEPAARRLRKAWQLGNAAIRDLIAVMEDHGVRVFEVKGPEAFDGLSGIAGKEAFVAIGAGWPGDRQRLTLAHELGHLVMQMPAKVSKSNAEKLCYRFAGALLLPAERIKAELGGRRHRLTFRELQDLKKEYGTSMQAILRRALDLDIISAITYQHWMRVFRQRGWHKREPGHAVPAERPHRKDRLLERLLAEDLISEGRAAEIAGLPIEQIRQLGAGIEDATRN